MISHMYIGLYDGLCTACLLKRLLGVNRLMDCKNRFSYTVIYIGIVNMYSCVVVVLTRNVRKIVILTVTPVVMLTPVVTARNVCFL